MADLQKLVQELSTLTVMEAAELSKQLEETWGVSAAVAVAAPAAGPAAAPVEEKTHFDITLVDAGAQKINVIKEIRVINSSINLMEAKELVEKLPAVIKKGATKEEADKFKKLLEAAGAKVELK